MSAMPYKIMIVASNSFFESSLKPLFSIPKYRVKRYATLSSAINHLKSHKWDLLLVDMDAQPFGLPALEKLAQGHEQLSIIGLFTDRLEDNSSMDLPESVQLLNKSRIQDGLLEFVFNTLISAQRDLKGIGLDWIYRKSLEGSRIGIWHWNIKTGETQFNKHWFGIIGYSVDELEPISIDTWYAKVHPGDRAISERALKQHFEGKTEFYDCEVRMIHKKGYEVWVQDRGRVHTWTPNGEPLLMSGTHVDVTDQKRHIIDIANNLDNQLTFFDSINDIVFVLNSDLAVTKVNQLALHALQGSTADFVGKHLTDLYEQEDQTPISKRFHEVLNGKINSFKARLTTKNGQHIQTLSFVSSTKYDNDLVYILLCRDLTSTDSYSQHLMERSLLPDYNSSPIIQADDRGTILYQNDAAREFLLLQSDHKTDCVPKLWRDLIVRMTQSKSVHQTAEVRVEDGYYLLEFRHIMLENKPIINIYVTNITETKIQQIELESQTNLTSALLNTFPDMLFLLSPDGIILDFRADESELYTKNNTIVGLNLGSLLPTEVSDIIKLHTELALKHQRLEKFEYELEAKFGRKEYFEARISPIQSKDEVLAIVRNISQRVKKTERLNQIGDLQESVLYIAKRMFEYGPGRVDEAINIALSDLGTFTGADRCYIFKLHDGKMSNIFEYAATGISKEIDNLQNLPVSIFPWWMERITNNLNVIIPKVSEMGPESSAEKQILEAQDIQSLVAVPLPGASGPQGFLGFDFVRSEADFKEQIVLLLNLAGNLFGQAMILKEQVEKTALNAARLEASLQQLMGDNPYMILVTDYNHRILYANNRLLEQTGYNSSFIIGNKAGFAKSNKTNPQQYASMRKKLKQNLPWEGEFKNLNQRGKVYIEKATIIPVKDGKGQLIQYFKIAEDITEKTKIDHRRELQERIYSMLAGYKSEYYALTETSYSNLSKLLHEQFDADFSVLSVGWGLNSEQMLTFTLPKLNKKSVKTIESTYKILLGDQAEFAMVWDKTSNDQLLPEWISDIVPQETLPKVELMMIYLNDSNLLIFGSFDRTCNWDVVELSTLESVVQLRENIETRARGYEAYAIKTHSDKISKLASGISHEVKNPLSIIQTGVDYLRIKYSDKDKATRTIIENMQQSIERSNNTLQGLMDIDKYRVKSTDLPLEYIQIGEIISIVINMFALQARELGIRILYKEGEGIPPILLPREALVDCFVNLFKNAIEAMGKGGKLHIKTKYDARCKLPVSISIKDTGIGISPENLSRVFESYFSTKQGVKGLGLGLYQVRNTLESFGATIEIANNKTKGVTVTIKLKEQIHE